VVFSLKKITISAAFQLSVWKVIVLAVSGERCVVLVDGLWTSTTGVRLMWTGRWGVKNPIFLWTS